jgi:hypothetical protein
MELNQERFAQKYGGEERGWWFGKLAACRKVDSETQKITIDHAIHGFSVCCSAFYEAHGFTGQPVSGRTRNIESSIKRGMVFAPDEKRGPARFAKKSLLIDQWIWRHIKVHGDPKPNASSAIGTVYILLQDIKDRHGLYIKDVTCDGKYETGDVSCASYPHFVKRWRAQIQKGWVDETGNMFTVHERESCHCDGMANCHICEKCFERLNKATSKTERELIRNEKALHLKAVHEAREQYASNVYDGTVHDDVLSCGIDAMEQAKSQVPITASNSKLGIKHKLQLKLTGILLHPAVWIIVTTCPWIKVGANITVTCFMLLLSFGYLDSCSQLLIQWDGASDNINLTCIYFFSWLLLAAQKCGIKLCLVRMSRMFPGHTKFDVDQHWSVLSQYLYGNKRQGNRHRDIYTIDSFEQHCRKAHSDLDKYVLLHHCHDWDTYLNSMRAGGDVDKDLQQTFVVELSTSSAEADAGQVFVRKKHRMGKSVAWSPKTQFYPHVEANAVQALPADDAVPEMADFKSWDLSSKARKILVKQLKAANPTWSQSELSHAAKERLPPQVATWQQKSQSILKDIKKFANNGYSCHIVDTKETDEINDMLNSIPDKPSDLPDNKKIPFCNPFIHWGGNGTADQHTDGNGSSESDVENIHVDEEVPNLLFGLGRQQRTSMLQGPVVEATKTDDTEPANGVVPDAGAPAIADSNPRPAQRRRHMYQVGAKVKTKAYSFGSDFAVGKYGQRARTAMVTGGIIQSQEDNTVTGKPQWKVIWPDGDVFTHPQSELRLET